MTSKKRKRKRKYRPYEQVKMKLFKVPDPFGQAPVEVRRAAMSAVGAEARARFDAEFPKLTQWFETYDPIYILSFCAFYFLSTEQGIDKEAIEGKVDFASHHLELLQALALMRPRSCTLQPLGVKAEELRRSLREVTESLGLAEFDLPKDLPEAQMRKRLALAEMRGQTFAIRNWAYPEQALWHLKETFKGSLARITAKEY